MNWVKCLERLPIAGSKVLCRIEPCGLSGAVEEHEMIAVDESDCSWRFPDGCELSYDWTVTEWLEV